MFHFQSVLEVRRPGHAAGRSCLSNTEDKNVRVCNSIASYAFLMYKQTNLLLSPYVAE